MREAGARACSQVHLSGGEPASRRDLEEITAGARCGGLYTNLITSAVGVTPARSARSPKPGSITCRSPSRTACREADRIAGYDGAYRPKRALADEVTRLGCR